MVVDPHEQLLFYTGGREGAVTVVKYSRGVSRRDQRPPQHPQRTPQRTDNNRRQAYHYSRPLAVEHPLKLQIVAGVQDTRAITVDLIRKFESLSNNLKSMIM